MEITKDQVLMWVNNPITIKLIESIEEVKDSLIEKGAYRPGLRADQVAMNAAYVSGAMWMSGIVSDFAYSIKTDEEEEDEEEDE